MATRNQHYDRLDTITMARNASIVVCGVTALGMFFHSIGMLDGGIEWADWVELLLLIAATIGIAQHSRFCALIVTLYVAGNTLAALMYDDDIHLYGGVALGLLNYSLVHGTYCLFKLHIDKVERSK